ncbi:PepSY domain-containing protein [Thalassococcus sp. BH17M4-6]|uniref:PepSY domain-containing protein n=1 Tax=Thalassococcus sp. BH17M4-6 TaxID=3413148 RepID=UPI003BEC6056
MTRIIFLTTASALLVGTVAFAQSFTDKIVSDLQANGFDRIEIKVGPTQTKAEAIDGARKIEVIYDNATGSIVKQEVESAAGESISPGVQIRNEDRDFVDARRSGSASGPRDDDDNDDEDDDDDDHRSGRDDDDDDGTDDNDGRGGDDDRDDDRGDDDDDDRGGHRGHGGDDHDDDDDRGGRGGHGGGDDDGDDDDDD